MEIIITSILAFASTNIDDLFILILFFGNKKFKEKEIIAGQFLGIIVLVCLSIAGSLLGMMMGQEYIGLLGLIPIYLGVKGFLALIKNKKEGENPGFSSNRSHVFTVAGVTIANGGDNIGIYIPLFATLNLTEMSIMIFIFLFMTFIWCLAAKYLVKHPYVANTVDKYGHLITPFVLVLLGIYILYESGTFEYFIM